MLVVSAIGRSSPPHLLPTLLCSHTWIDRQRARYLHPHHTLFSLYLYPLICLSASSSFARVSSLSIALASTRLVSLFLWLAGWLYLSAHLYPPVAWTVCFLRRRSFSRWHTLSSYLLLGSSSLQRLTPVVAEQNLAGGRSYNDTRASSRTLYIASHWYVPPALLPASSFFSLLMHALLTANLLCEAREERRQKSEEKKMTLEQYTSAKYIFRDEDNKANPVCKRCRRPL